MELRVGLDRVANTKIHSLLLPGIETRSPVHTIVTILNELPPLQQYYLTYTNHKFLHYVIFYY